MNQETKTKDNVFVSIPVAVQYVVDEHRVVDAYYRLSDPEEQIRSYSTYRYLTCATVVRTDDHLMRPADYIPIDRFLAHTGFNPLLGITTSFTWLETDGVKRSHPMNFWIKGLSA